jgi:peptidoglycan hydrolase-like protein with peptidoglycan-binding domain
MTHRAIQKWAGVPATGSLDLETRKAVQKKLGLKPDGVWGPVTVSAIQRGINDGTL